MSPERVDLLILAGAAIAAVALGLVLVHSPLLAGLGVACAVFGVAALRFGLLAAVVPAFALLPWLVIFEGVAPPLLGTFATAAAVACLLLAVVPLRFEHPVVAVAGVVFVTLLVGHAVFSTSEGQFIVGAKYMIFPALAVALASDGAKDIMPMLKTPLFVSAVAALLVHLALALAGVGAVGTYYGVGERLGLAAEIPHALALLATVVAGAGLALGRMRLQVPVFTLGVVVAMLTAVRSAFLGIGIMVAVFFWKSPTKLRVAGLLLALVAIAFATGAADVVVGRLGSEGEEFSTFETAGSGRGLIWTVAVNGWIDAGPGAWIYGAGLRAAVDFELAAIGIRLVAHSDLIEVAVQLGLLGLLAWIGLWYGMLRSGLSPIVLLPIVAFGLVNGSLEYLPSLATGMVLAAACVDRRDGKPPEG